ncbi:hypothetical protein [Roseococcus sp. YIM B11640]|uniref:hypothetical protein n=1 Tax=Roseococcus sp. YIM B11640 TaxID=3133973 RepID=UPI003C7B9BB7
MPVLESGFAPQHDAWPIEAEDQDAPSELWLPAWDVSLMSMAALVFVAAAHFFT